MQGQWKSRGYTAGQHRESWPSPAPGRRPRGPGADAEKNRQLESWLIIQRSHAIANNLPVICCNRTGHETDVSKQTGGIDFWGNSFIAGPQGEILEQASGDKDQLLITEIDLGRTEVVRHIWPFFRDRRIDAYETITKRFEK